MSWEEVRYYKRGRSFEENKNTIQGMQENFVSHMSGFVYRMYKELSQLYNKKTIQLKNLKNI